MTRSLPCYGGVSNTKEVPKSPETVAPEEGRARVVDTVHLAMIAGVSVGTFRAHVTARVRAVRPARRTEVVRALFQRTSAPPAILGRALDRVSVITDGAFVALGAGRVVLTHL